MDILVGPRWMFMWDLYLTLEMRNSPKCFIEQYSRVSHFQISWYSKSGLLKTKVYPNKKFPFVTTINGTEYQSDNIKSVLRLISKK